jgi:hypothetical protein
MNSPSTERNDMGGLAAMIGTRLSTEARIARAAAFVWLCGGIAAALVLVGVGCELGLVGYSQLISVRPAADLVGHAIVVALERAKLTTNITGTVTLAQNTELTLAADQTVSLNEGATIKLDENSSVRVAADVHVPQPSKQQLQLNAMTRSDELPFTNYTIFKEVEFGKGYVATGWNYDFSDTIRPKSQICSYKQSLEKGVTAKYTIAVNNSPQRPSALTTLSFDFEGALRNCVWFSGY